MVSLFQGVLVEPISLISGVSLNNSSHFVDLAGKSSSTDEFRKLPIDEIEWDTELISHGLKLDGFVRFKELWVYDDSGFPDEIASVVVEVRVVLDQINYSYKHLEEAAVPAVVERLNVVIDIWKLHQIDDSFRRVKYFLLDADSVHVENSSQHAVSDQFLVAHHFWAVEGG